jgi:hypothetical protein
VKNQVFMGLSSGTVGWAKRRRRVPTVF